MKTIGDLMALWPKPSTAVFARDIGITRKHAQTMKERGSIPVAYWPGVVAAAKTRKLEGVTLDLLVQLCARSAPAAEPIEVRP